MAGGPLAKHVPCPECLGDGRLTEATRTGEGRESDQYRCGRGHRFGMGFRAGPATEAQWPPSPDLVAYAEEQRAQAPEETGAPWGPLARVRRWLGALARRAR